MKHFQFSKKKVGVSARHLLISHRAIYHRPAALKATAGKVLTASYSYFKPTEPPKEPPTNAQSTEWIEPNDPQSPLISVIFYIQEHWKVFVFVGAHFGLHVGIVWAIIKLTLDNEIAILIKELESPSKTLNDFKQKLEQRSETLNDIKQKLEQRSEILNEIKQKLDNPPQPIKKQLDPNILTVVGSAALFGVFYTLRH